ncbi:MAG TPA: sigma-54 dependent transcriptional regulator [Acidobacteriaceae bacterium]|nr:sigma-54 dependent transcriptional regulator [Acidobacteriaceae bacterium]
MAVTQVQVLLAVLDTAHSAPLAQVLMQAGATVSLVQVRSTDHLLEKLCERTPNLLVLELDQDGSLLEQVRARHPYLPIVVALFRPTEKITFSISRLGAEDVWTLPLDTASIVERAQSVLERLPVPVSAPAELRGDDGGASAPAISPVIEDGEEVDPSMPLLPPPAMVGANPRMSEIRNTVEKVAGTDVTVLIRGESGVGKEVIARLLFEYSRRRQKPFIKVNCAAIPHDLLESELFGYEAGAFTGATRDKPGKFELANHGTLFLDEIAEMHPMLQAKLLHVLQDGTFSRLGAKRDVAVDVRVVCATNKLLEERVRDGLFREDLLYRINVVTIFLPPLRERRDEIPVLTDYLLRKYAIQYGRPLRRFSPEAAERMAQYDWPGNIRELENLCKRFVIVGSETQILRELSSHGNVHTTVPAAASSHEQPMTSHQTAPTAGETPDVSELSLLEVGRRAAWEAERRAIQQMLETTHWNRREASRRLQVSYKALLNKIKQMQLEENAAKELGTEIVKGNSSAQ